jgi:hypothetical protein
MISMRLLIGPIIPQPLHMRISGSLIVLGETRDINGFVCA